MDKNKHKFYMAQILSLIFKDKDLCNVLAFKGGTSLMFFHNLNQIVVPMRLPVRQYLAIILVITRYCLTDSCPANRNPGLCPGLRPLRLV